MAYASIDKKKKKNLPTATIIRSTPTHQTHTMPLLSKFITFYTADFDGTNLGKRCLVREKKLPTVPRFVTGKILVQLNLGFHISPHMYLPSITECGKAVPTTMPPTVGERYLSAEDVGLVVG